MTSLFYEENPSIKLRSENLVSYRKLDLIQRLIAPAMKIIAPTKKKGDKENQTPGDLNCYMKSV
ncbi:MAG TPA: hypothetical protein VFN95_01645, partial [Flavitalea sp.]|nr:hypothetical protein [Flavitalea sp.]